MNADLSATRDSWQGARYETVVRHWGAPARNSVLADGREVHTWFSQTGGGGLYPSVGISSSGSGAADIGTGTGVMLNQSAGEAMRCERTLYFRDGVVVEQSWLGPLRYCSTFRRN